MSHVAEIKCVMKSLEDIEAAAKRLGGTLVRGQKTYRWYGNWVGDTPMPEGMTQADLGKCDHAITFPGANYDVGVRQQKDGSYRLAWDYWNSGGLLKYMGDQRGGKIAQAYAVEAAKRKAKQKGYVTNEKVRPDGTIDLELLVH